MDVYVVRGGYMGNVLAIFKSEADAQAFINEDRNNWWVERHPLREWVVHER